MPHRPTAHVTVIGSQKKQVVGPDRSQNEQASLVYLVSRTFSPVSQPDTTRNAGPLFDDIWDGLTTCNFAVFR
jgi:hypothetical protein